MTEETLISKVHRCHRCDILSWFHDLLSMILLGFICTAGFTLVDLFFWLLLFLLIAMCGAFNIKNMGINIGYTWLYFDVVFVPRSSYPSECKLWKWDRWFATWCNTWCRTQQGSMIQPTFIKVCVVYYNILPPHVRTRVGLHVKFPCFFLLL